MFQNAANRFDKCRTSKKPPGMASGRLATGGF
ncbi:hypothetical protein BSS2_I0746 [Brucella suis bv. 1 str. S2]|uniref:Uncharacterized protein n=1 Tax=Brucella suis biovar 1 (strain 1330) TaxID=204722 RepID=A0A0H3G6W3_BRUSU|nr:hypothetical protein BR0763 [Brucella suis 1330]AEU05777.1 hypothetical protein BSVBI22_A0759 [Brucella suis VBI22]AHN46401.1 hypothetical protein BSS2_I0746 [Brucella suis bv. 1 str. S2]EXU83573.1 hypothetical protein AX23_05525 [Brucella melitensis 548]CDL76166.1 unnamed protein product [Brucella canis str. Oliveri]